MCGCDGVCVCVCVWCVCMFVYIEAYTTTYPAFCVFMDCNSICEGQSRLAWRDVICLSWFSLSVYRPIAVRAQFWTPLCQWKSCAHMWVLFVCKLCVCVCVCVCGGGCFHAFKHKACESSYLFSPLLYFFPLFYAPHFWVQSARLSHTQCLETARPFDSGSP